MRLSPSNISRISEYILRKAEGDYQYVHDPEHRNKPHGKFWPTEKGWSNDPKDAPKSQQTQYPYELTPSDNEYFEAVKSNNTEALTRMVTDRAKEAGYGIKAYHGTKANFNAFNLNKIQNTAEGVGFYFADDPSVASGYGKVKSLFLSMKKPLAHDGKAFNKSTLSKILTDIAKEEFKANRDEMEDIADGFLSNYGDIRHEGFNKVLNEAVNSLSNEPSANHQLGGIYHSGVSLPLLASSVKKVTGYDGYISRGEKDPAHARDYLVYIAWSPNQIKSADPIVKDDNGNIIPPSQRFNPNSADTRF
jgi:hypothetical protein